MSNEQCDAHVCEQDGPLAFLRIVVCVRDAPGEPWIYETSSAEDAPNLTIEYNDALVFINFNDEIIIHPIHNILRIQCEFPFE